MGVIELENTKLSDYIRKRVTVTTEDLDKMKKEIIDETTGLTRLEDLKANPEKYGWKHEWITIIEQHGY